MSRIRVAVIGGGQNCEHEVSLASAAAAAETLADHPADYDVVRLTIGTDGTWRDATDRPLGFAAAVGLLGRCDVAVPVVHGPHGEDGTLAALLDLAGVAYVGSGVGAGALAMDKWVTKLIAEAQGIATAPGTLLTARTAHGYAWHRPVVVKPVSAGSSRGVSLVDDPARLAAALDAALALDDRVLVEEVVVGREIDIAVLGRPDGTTVVSPPLEIAVDGLFGYDVKYGGSAVFHVPASLTPAELKALESAARTMYETLGCRGVARVDFFLTAAGLVLNEVNTMPGLTAHSQVPRMFAAAGLSYRELLDLLIRDVRRDVRRSA
jgi:D-alanine-D-alanine ligase